MACAAEKWLRPYEPSGRNHNLAVLPSTGAKASKLSNTGRCKRPASSSLASGRSSWPWLPDLTQSEARRKEVDRKYFSAKAFLNWHLGCLHYIRLWFFSSDHSRYCSQKLPVLSAHFSNRLKYKTVFNTTYLTIITPPKKCLIANKSPGRGLFSAWLHCLKLATTSWCIKWVTKNWWQVTPPLRALHKAKGTRKSTTFLVLVRDEPRRLKEEWQY